MTVSSRSAPRNDTLLYNKQRPYRHIASRQDIPMAHEQSLPAIRMEHYHKPKHNGMESCQPQPKFQLSCHGSRIKRWQMLLSVVNPKYKDKIDKDGKRCEAVKSIRWFTSSDNYFIKYNKVRTFKGLFVDHKTFEEKCKDTKK